MAKNTLDPMARIEGDRSEVKDWISSDRSAKLGDFLP